MLTQLVDFLKHPEYNEADDMDMGHRFNLVFGLLVLSLGISLALGFFIGILESSTSLDFGKHAIDGFLDTYSPAVVFLAAVFLAPLLEELLFRGPLIFFKKSRYFGPVFYIITLTFAFYHITNFERSAVVWLLSPVLVAPQFLVGLILGYTRVRLGLIWAILLHALYNLTLLAPVLLVRTLNGPLV